MKKKFKFLRYSFLNIAFIGLLITILFYTSFTYAVRCFGEIKCEESVLISSNISGFTNEVLFNKGDLINKGDTLIIISNKEIRLKLQKLEIQNEIMAAELRNEENKLLNAEKEFNRIKKLFKSEDVTAQRYDKQELQYNNSVYQVEKIKIQLKKLHIDISELELQNSYTIITAPISGIVSQKRIGKNEYITQLVPVIQIDNIEGMYFEAAIDESSINKIEINQKAQVILHAYSNSTQEPLNGVVTKVFPSELNENGKLFFPVKIKFNNPSSELTKMKIMPHMKGKSRVIIGTDKILKLSNNKYD
jgi:membrane fusion protein (multidrug efflux system)